MPRLLVGILVAGCLASVQDVRPAFAQEDDNELTFEQKIIEQIMTGLGAQTGPGIEYRERSPLVIPPSPELPTPENPDAIKARANWPHDPDLQRRKPVPQPMLGARREQLKSDDSMALLPSELNKPNAPRGAGRVTTPEPDYNYNQGRRLSPSALGYVGGIFGSVFGKEEEVRFTGEPPRTALTDPPTGLQTPSPAQPYGVKESGWFPKALNPFDRGTDPR